MNRLSPSQIKALGKRREPIRHAMDRLIERHMPEIDDDTAEDIINVMTTLCQFQYQFGTSRVATIVNVENETSVIIDLDMFEDRGLIRVCYDPIAERIKTVFPIQVEVKR